MNSYRGHRDFQGAKATNWFCEVFGSESISTAFMQMHKDRLSFKVTDAYEKVAAVANVQINHSLWLCNAP